MKVVYQGATGAFGHQACLDFLPDHEPVAKPTFGDVIAAVESGEAELGILPLENNEAGPTGAEALIEASSLRIVAQHASKKYTISTRQYRGCNKGAPTTIVRA